MEQSNCQHHGVAFGNFVPKKYTGYMPERSELDTTILNSFQKGIESPSKPLR